MFSFLLKSIFGTQNSRELKRLSKSVNQINQLESGMQALTDQQLKALTTDYKQRIQTGESLDDLLPEAFATVREVSKRVMNMRHFDVQLIGGMALHEGRIAEMRTGEGKTLVATLAAYLNALSGKGVHIVTVNDYLSKRDAHWMGPIYNFLGISLGVIQSSGTAEYTSFIYQTEAVDIIARFEHLQPCDRRKVYECDIVYGTNNEFGFDYLRTNMVTNKESRLQKQLNFAIVDEVDSILIDEARTPLIISGPVDNKQDLYKRMDKLVKPLKLQPQGHTDLLKALAQGEVRFFDDEPYFVSLGLEASAMKVISQLRALDENKELERSIKQQQRDDLMDSLYKALEGDFTHDEKIRSIELTEQGFEKMEKSLVSNKLLDANESLYDSHNLILLQHVNSVLRAQHMFKRNVEYIVQGGEVILIDEHTGRKMPGRRLSEGLHQAIEAKEKLTIQNESQTMASTTFQNYFRLYKKLSGMTGTADTEAPEFLQIYNLRVLVIPTNQTVARVDHNDLIFMSKKDKYAAVINDIKTYQKAGAPILLGTVSIDASEVMSKMLKKEGIKHSVLNAKYHEQEAEIIARAGEPGRVTIATNMAGRGTDIVLGGNLEATLVTAALNNEAGDSRREQLTTQWKKLNQQVIDAGGLHVLGTERHESRRIDNQLRGRSGRQGDPGLSRFYLSMEDDLMRLFASDKMRGFMQNLGMEGEAIEHKMVSNSVERAQRKVETRNFDIRKGLLEFDDVANDQRTVIYQQRNQIIDSDEMREIIARIRSEIVEDMVLDYLPRELLAEQWDLEGLQQYLTDKYELEIDIENWLNEDDNRRQIELTQLLDQRLTEVYQGKISSFPEEVDIAQFERDIMLRTLDQQWRDHLATMDSLRSSINLRSYAQKNPKQEYKRESFELFQHLLSSVKKETISTLCKVRLLSEEEIEVIRKREAQLRQLMQAEHEDSQLIGNQEQKEPLENSDSVRTFIREGVKVGRNDPCPCGSGKKYKQCCGKL